MRKRRKPDGLPGVEIRKFWELGARNWAPSLVLVYMIKVLHFADFHLGVDTIGPVDPETKLNGRVLDYLDTLDALVEYAEANGADLVLFAGDAFHKHNPEPTYVREFGERVLRLSNLCPIVLLTGNHDMPGIIEKASAIDVFDALKVPNVYIGWTDELLRINTKHGLVQVATVPYPMKQQLLPAKYLRKDADTVMDALRTTVGGIIRKLGEECDLTQPKILLGHFTVNGAVYGAENSYIARDAEIDVDTLLEPWDYVALGHLHTHQMVGNDNIVYAGSLERVDFSEENVRKGFVWVEFEGCEANWQFIEVDARPYKTLRFDFVGRKVNMGQILKAINGNNLQGCVVRIIIDVEEGIIITIDDINKALEAVGAWYFTIAIRRNVPRRPNKLDMGDGRSVASMSPYELLEAFFSDKTEEKRKLLLDLAADIMDEVNAQV